MTQKREWCRRQSEHSRRFYERIAAGYDDLADWKATALFRSALHRASYWLDALTGRAPKSHSERNRRVGRELPTVSDDYRALCRMSREARCSEGFRFGDARGGHAAKLMGRIEKELPFLQTAWG